MSATNSTLQLFSLGFPSSPLSISPASQTLCLSINDCGFRPFETPTVHSLPISSAFSYNSHHLPSIIEVNVIIQLVVMLYQLSTANELFMNTNTVVIISDTQAYYYNYQVLTLHTN